MMAMADNLFAACEPRTDVLQGALKESDFEANLSQVLRDDAPDEYKKPEVFFANTYPTKGLKLRAFDKSDALKLIPLLKSVPNATKRVELEVSFETQSKSEASITFKGDLDDAASLKDYFEPQFRAASEGDACVVADAQP